MFYIVKIIAIKKEELEVISLILKRLSTKNSRYYNIFENVIFVDTTSILYF
jgi:hypothetical protein